LLIAAQPFSAKSFKNPTNENFEGIVIFDVFLIVLFFHYHLFLDYK